MAEVPPPIRRSPSTPLTDATNYSSSRDNLWTEGQVDFGDLDAPSPTITRFPSPGPSSPGPRRNPVRLVDDPYPSSANLSSNPLLSPPDPPSPTTENAPANAGSSTISRIMSRFRRSRDVNYYTFNDPSTQERPQSHASTSSRPWSSSINPLTLSHDGSGSLGITPGSVNRPQQSSSGDLEAGSPFADPPTTRSSLETFDLPGARDPRLRLIDFGSEASLMDHNDYSRILARVRFFILLLLHRVAWMDDLPSCLI